MGQNWLANILRHKTLLILGCVVLLLCIFLMFAIGESPEQKLIDKYFKAFEKNDAEAVLDLFYEPIVERERKATKLSWTQYLKDVDKFYGRYGSDITKKSTLSTQKVSRKTLHGLFVPSPVVMVCT